jgi:hypothetical protein
MEIFKDYGVSILINGVFLYAALQLINIGISMLKTKQQQSVAQTNMLLATLPKVQLSQEPYSIERPRTEEKQNKHIEVEGEIKTLMDRAMRDSGGDRVTIMEYNTPNPPSLAVLPYAFMSCTFEVYREGKLPVCHIMQQISTTLFSKFIIKLQTEPYVILDLKDQDATSKAGFELVRAQEASQSLCSSLRDMESKPIGYVSLKKDEAITDADIERIKELAKDISFLLNAKAGKGADAR